MYALQQDTQSVLMSEFYYHKPNLRIQRVKNTPDDGPVRSETFRANISAE